MTRPAHVAIVGAPRCATTTLYDHLVSVFPGLRPMGKDVFRLVDRDSGLFEPATSVHERGTEWYRDLAVRPGTVTLDAGAGHLYHTTARKVLASLPVRVVGIVVVRDPVDRLVSVHRYFANNRREIDRPLEPWLREQLAGTATQADETIRCALDQGRYEQWIPDWERTFRDAGHRLEVVPFDDVVAGAADLVATLVDDLGLAPMAADVPWSNAALARPRPRPVVAARRVVGRALPVSTRGRLRRPGVAPGPRPEVALPDDLLDALDRVHAPTRSWMRARGLGP